VIGGGNRPGNCPFVRHAETHHRRDLADQFDLDPLASGTGARMMYRRNFSNASRALGPD